MSNALIVDAKHSAHGHPTAVFGPQTGYYAPQLLMEEELRGPHTAARGVSFAGTNFVVELGRGVDYAWSATSPYTDITDTVVQPLCNTDGSPPTVDSDGVRRRRRPVHADGALRAHRDRLPDPGRAGHPEADQAPGAAHRPRHRAAADDRAGAAGRGGAAAVDLHARGRLGARLRPPQRPVPGPRRPRLHAGRVRHPVRVQLVLRRRPGHRLLQLRAAAPAGEGHRPGPAAVGEQRPTTGTASSPSAPTPTS